MKNVRTDNELKKELHELYTLTKHWSADLGFLEEDLQYLKNLLHKYDNSIPGQQLPQNTIFEQKIFELEDDLASIRARIPVFLSLLALFFENPEKPMDLATVEKYNRLRIELHSLFTAATMTKKELLAHKEAIITCKKTKPDL